MQYRCIFHEQHSKFEIDICLNDVYEVFMKAKTLCLQPMLNVKEGKASCLLAIIEWVRKLEFKQVIFILDSKRVVNSFNLTINDRFEVCSILSICGSILQLFVTTLMSSFLGDRLIWLLIILLRLSYTTLVLIFILTIFLCINLLIFNGMH